MSNQGGFFKNTSIYVIGEVIPRLLSFITFPILTSYLTPADYGINSYVASLTSFLFILSNLSLSTYFFVHYFRAESEDARKKLTGTLAIFTTVYSLILVLIVLAFGPYLLELWGSKVDFYPFVFLGVIAMYFEVLIIYPSAIYRVIEKPITLITFNISKAVINVIGILFVVYFLKGTLKDILLIQTIISAVLGFAFVFYSRKFFYVIFDKQLIKNAMSFSLPLVPASISWYAYNTFDRVLIDKYLTLNDLGLFSTATTLALMLNIVTNSAYKAFEPLFFKYFGKDEFDNIYNSIKNMYIFMTLLGALYLSLFSKEFFEIFSSESFLSSYKYVPYILIGTVTSSVGLIYGTIITAMGKTKHNAVITILGAIISIMVNIMLLKVIGIWAAILSSAITYIVSLIIRMYFSGRKIFEFYSFCAFILTFLPAIFFNNVDIKIGFIYQIILKGIISLIIIYILSLLLNIDVKHLVNKFLRREKKI
jgi:O-antigen/teichoic acid export membrane protein